MHKQKLLTTLGVLIMCLLLIGCSGPKTTQENNKPNQGTEDKTNITQPNTKLESDTALAQQLESEKGIERVMVQVVEGEQRAVNVDIVINNEQGLSADQVIEKYSKVIKEKYPDRTIDIIVAKEGKLLKQTTLK